MIVTAPNVTATTENGQIDFQVASGGGAAALGSYHLMISNP